MKASEKRRIEELEKRVRELEARPYWPTTIIVCPQTPPPPVYPWPVIYRQPEITWTAPVTYTSTGIIS